MLDPGLLATLSLTSLYVVADFRPSRSLFRSECVVLFVNSLYAESVEAVKLRAALSASSSELICILDEINSETSL
jgi:hypothetical protein